MVAEESKTRLFSCRAFRVLLLAACLLVTVDPLLAQQGTTRATLTSEQIQSRITAVRDSAEIDDAARTRAIGLYQQAVANLETTRSNSETAEAYRKTGGTASEQMTAIRASMERRRAVDSVVALNITPTVDGARQTHLNPGADAGWACEEIEQVIVLGIENRPTAA